MIKRFIRGAAFMLMAALSLQSCTVSEPKTPSGDASQLLLKQVTAYGITMINFNYDNLNRITKIEIGKDSSYELEYESGSTSTVPSRIVVSEFEEKELNDKTQYVMTEQEIWTNIHANNEAMITSADMATTLWYYGVEWDYETEKDQLVLESEHHETSHETWFYNSNGQLTANTSVSNDDMGNTTTDAVTMVWQNGNLISFTDNDVSNQESGAYEYSDVDNKNGQWDPLNNVIGPIAISGLFGKAPARFMKSETISYNGYVNESYQYAYTLLDNGLINLAKVYDSTDGESMVVKFVYVKAK